MSMNPDSKPMRITVFAALAVAMLLGGSLNAQATLGQPQTLTEPMPTAGDNFGINQNSLAGGGALGWLSLGVLACFSEGGAAPPNHQMVESRDRPRHS